MCYKNIGMLFNEPDYAPQLRCRGRTLVLMALLCLFIAAAFETLNLSSDSSTFEQEHQASLKAQSAMHAVREFRHALNIPIDPVLDPNQTGLIGSEYTDLTTTEGILSAKRTATNPAFAGFLVKLMHQAGLKEGDYVAISMTGSFPSLNIATLAACETMGVKPFIISSVGASTYGANIPDFTWLDMETYLYDQGIFPYKSFAVSLGGVVETHGGIDGQAFVLAEAAIARHGGMFLAEGDYRSVEHDVMVRKQLYEAQGSIKAFINVGGSLSALGWTAEAAKLDTGLLKRTPATTDAKRGLIFRFSEEHIPVIHMLNVARLAEMYALPIDPIPLPQVQAFSQQRFFNRYLFCMGVLVGWCLIGIFFFYREVKNKEAPLLKTALG